MTTLQAQYKRISIAQLIDFCRPLVEVGYDACQIGFELNRQSVINYTDSEVQLAINTILGE